MLKKTLKITGIVLLVLIGVAVAAPYLFKNQIIQKVKKEINKNLNANVDFKDVDISFFRQFPKVAIALDSLRITGKDVFANDTLFVAERVDAALNIMSVIKGKDMKIYSIFIASPRIHAIVNKDSLVNWDIMKPDSSNTNTASDKPFKMALQKYTVQNAYINYTDITSDLVTEIFNLNHEGKGDFTADLFTLKTSTSTDALTVTYGGIPFLAHAKATVDADIEVDNKANIYRYNTDKIMLNDLQLSSRGAVINLDKNGYDLDLTFNAPSTDFKNLLSLVPAIYEKDFAKIKTNGKALFSGFVKGIYNDKTLPAYHVDLEVKDGYFQYPDLPKPLQQINIKAQIDNPDGITDHTIVNIEKGHFEMDNDPFDIRLLVKNPVTNMFIDAAAKGKLDLGNIAQMVKLEPGTKLSGLLNADVFVKGIVTAIEQQKQDQFSAGGTIDLNQFLYVAKDYPTGVKINSLQTEFSPAKVAINVLSGQYLSTNFNGTGQINNLLNYLLQNKALQANLTVNADNLNLYEWMGTAADTAVKPKLRNSNIKRILKDF